MLVILLTQDCPNSRTFAVITFGNLSGSQSFVQFSNLSDLLIGQYGIGVIFSFQSGSPPASL